MHEAMAGDSLGLLVRARKRTKNPFVVCLPRKGKVCKILLPVFLSSFLSIFREMSDKSGGMVNKSFTGLSQDCPGIFLRSPENLVYVFPFCHINNFDPPVPGTIPKSCSYL